MGANFLSFADSIRYDCLLCPNKIPNEFLHKQHAGNEITISLKVLLKYLDIDLVGLALASGIGLEGEKEGISMRLCEKCSALANLFEEIHEDFEAARLLLTECVSKFMGRVKAASKMSSGTDGDHLWRAELLKQCDLHLQKVPKEELDKISSDLFDSDSSIERLEELSFEDQTATGSISSVFEQITATPISSSTVQNRAVPSLEEMTIDDTGAKLPVGKLDDEMDQILKTNEDLIRRLSDIVSRAKFARQSTSTPTTTSAFTTSTIQEVVSPNVCLICGVTSYTPQNNQTHMMLVHTTSFFSEQFPPETTEVQVAHVVSTLLESSITTAGKRRVNCNLCGGVQRARSRKIHLLQYHLNNIIAGLKGEQGSSLGTPRNQFPASSESHAERSGIQRLAAKLSGRAKLKCHICGQWCFNKQGLTMHTRNTHSKSTKVIKPSTHLSALYKKITAKPSNSKPANATPRCDPTTTKISKWNNLLTCLYCSATLGTPYSCIRHMLVRHPLQYWAGELPPSTTQKTLDTAMKILADRQITISAKSKVDCRLCSRVCGEKSKTFHLLKKHPDAVLATLKSLVE